MRLVGVLGAWLAMLHGLAAGAGVESRDADVLRIGFGSCANQRKPNPMWRVMREAAPDLMVLLGDNVYADSVIVPPLRTPATVEALEQSYAQLLSLPDFQALRADTPLLAVFDDHDYGKNDGDESWELRTTAQRLLQDTFDQDPRLGIASRRQQSAMYTVWRHQWHGLRVRIILLDNRSHKSRQPRFYVSEHHAQDMLGPEQWSWLESELRTQSADLTIIGSGLQFVAQDKVAGEQWGRFPASRAKLLALLATTNTANVVFLSGDVHLAEMPLPRE
ncbi:uncharacterized protein MONBRDRAFT_23508 [Monosiga brevicollis MX1]|uniref:PhoD-like phosphatase metallophosphatase domain-containing protein n=1 Tax=Monosiga brevicollis TaxID=81824 RepID=A9UTM1_MONBE|nr:uncharacterized protein MONBRDRAFT_23508 [Monosiga brevicollis MX1]EDQ91518.1 predicted protein [Monosiga brevicollis MX1]|eukprot:XP_001743940.1 hypothetical protein [Monosiga brevicollis MX1]